MILHIEAFPTFFLSFLYRMDLFFYVGLISFSCSKHLQNRLNLTKTVRKFSIDRNLVPTGSEFHSGPIPTVSKHGDDVEESHGEGSVELSSRNFDSYSHQ
jgi:hypothetical protein